MLNQFSNLSCYEEFEIQCALTGVSKIDALKEIGHKVNDYYFFVSNDGIFNWFDLEGNHIEDPGILNALIEDPGILNALKAGHICDDILKCVIPNSVISINANAFSHCDALKEITIPDSVLYIGDYVFYYCRSLKEITIPDNVTSIGNHAFWFCESLNDVIFKGKTLEQVKQMENYPFGIEDESIIKCS